MSRRRLADVDPDAPVGTIVAALARGPYDDRVDGAGDVEVAVVRHAGGWVMVADRCTHADCPFTLDGEVFDGTVLVCNCHGSEYDLRTGEVLLGPAEVPLVPVPLEADGAGLRPAHG
ncbi:MAG: Rieske (2Fe-2S) protein [Kineosporiaceae bacterium]